MTVTSNLHIGLAAWTTSHVYTLGTRVSNSGNAYQVITAGTSALSGSGPTTTSSSITDGSVVWKYLSGIDYSTLAAWVSAIPGTLTQPIVGQLWNDGPITTTSGVAFLTLTGHTTTTTNTIKLTSAPGEGIRDSLAGQSTPLAFNSTNGVSFVMPASGVGAINYFGISDANVILDNLQMHDPNSSSGSTIIQFLAGGFLQGCVIDGYSQTSGADMIQFNTAGAGIMRNCLVIDRTATGAAAGSTISFGSTSTFHLVNSTIIGINTPSNSAAVFNSSTGAMTTTNTIIMGYTAAHCGAAPNGGTSTLQYSLFSNVASGLGGTNGAGNIFSASISNQFVNPATDFRLKTGAGALDTGTTDTSDIPTSDDIARTTRPQGAAWDIGAWEFVVAAISIAMPSVVSTGAVTPPSVILPTTHLGSVVSFGSVGIILVQNVITTSSMFTFVDGNIPNAQQFNGNFQNTIDKTTATPQSMVASLNIGGSMSAGNIVTTGMLTVQGGQAVAMNIFSANGSYAMQPTDYVVAINKVTPATTTVVLPSSPAPGRVYTIADGGGNSASFPITIIASQNITAYTTWVLNSAYASVSLVYSGVQWVVASSVGSVDGTVATSPGASRVSNTVSGSASAAIGATNVSSGTNSLAAGSTNTASGAQSIALGNNNTAGNGSVSVGAWANDRGRLGQLSFANGRLATNSGDSQYGLTTLRKTVAASATGRLTVDTLAASAVNCCNLPSGIAYGFGRIIVTAFDTVNVKAAMWYIDNLLIIRGVAASTTILVGTPTITLANASSSLSALTGSSITIAADTTNAGLNISLVNTTAVSLDAVAVISTSEIF